MTHLTGIPPTGPLSPRLLALLVPAALLALAAVLRTAVRLPGWPHE